MIARRPVPADIERIADLAIAYETTVHGFSDYTLADVAQDWKPVDLDGDAWVVEVDGRLAGAVCVLEHEPPFVDGAVHPDFAGRGVGTRLVALAEQVVRDRGATALRFGTLAADPRAAELFTGLGYTAIRHYFWLVGDLAAEPPAPLWPAGLVATTFDRVDPRAFHAALMEAFADEWGSHPSTYEEWHRRRVEEMPHDPGLLFAVLDGDEIAAVAVCSAQRSGMGWVAQLAVRRPWRRRGLGLALLLHVFREFRRRGEQRVGLAVDAENPTGATRLYERAGMRLSWSAVHYEKGL